VLRYFPTAVFVPCYYAFPTLPVTNGFACITSRRGQFDIPPLTCNNQPPQDGAFLKQVSQGYSQTTKSYLSWSLKVHNSD